MTNQVFHAGDVIEYENGHLDYLVAIPGEDGLWVNACNPSWIERGERTFCQECYPFFDGTHKHAKVVGHYGRGDASSARIWYEENKERYRG